MNHRLPLARRIVSAFVILTSIISATFAYSIFSTIHFVENQLISTELNRTIDRAIKEHIYTSPVSNNAHLLLYTASDVNLPDWTRRISTGFSEVFVDDKSFHALVRDVDGKRYYLLSDQSEFEEHERLLLVVVGIGLVMSIICAWLLAMSVVQKVISPLVLLSRKVQEIDEIDANATPLAPDFAEDEVGLLAQSFDSLIGRYKDALYREQLFSADVSHELRTPLMVITTTCELLKENKNIDERQQQKLLAIEAAANKINDLSNTFLLLLRNQNNKSDILPLASVEHILEGVEEQWRHKIEERQLKFTIESHRDNKLLLPEGPVKILIDNLLRNALNHTKKGGILLSISESFMSVKDSGLGLNEPNKNRVYSPFSHEKTSEKPGEGLGLSIIYRVCESQNWIVDYETSMDNGTEFIISFNSEPPLD